MQLALALVHNACAAQLPTQHVHAPPWRPSEQLLRAALALCCSADMLVAETALQALCEGIIAHAHVPSRELGGVLGLPAFFSRLVSASELPLLRAGCQRLTREHVVRAARVLPHVCSAASIDDVSRSTLAPLLASEATVADLDAILVRRKAALAAAAGGAGGARGKKAAACAASVHAGARARSEPPPNGGACAFDSEHGGALGGEPRMQFEFALRAGVDERVRVLQGGSRDDIDARASREDEAPLPPSDGFGTGLHGSEPFWNGRTPPTGCAHFWASASAHDAITDALSVERDLPALGLDLGLAFTESDRH